MGPAAKAGLALKMHSAGINGDSHCHLCPKCSGALSKSKKMMKSRLLKKMSVLGNIKECFPSEISPQISNPSRGAFTKHHAARNFFREVKALVRPLVERTQSSWSTLTELQSGIEEVYHFLYKPYTKDPLSSGKS